MSNITYNNFHQLVLNEIPLMDVRAPIEFAKGAFQTSYNLPIMTDEERRLVGIKYKNAGNEKATELGFSLVSGAIKDERVQGWKDFHQQNPSALLYCFRGGSRSQITQQWLREELGLDIPYLEGGYKAFRNYLMDALNPDNITMKPLVLGGHTGSGKTIILNQLQNTVDLEGLANHRGSSFGRHVTPQPSQINFENNLAFKLIQNQAKGYNYMCLEDEGNHVGACYLPKPLYQFFTSGDLIIIDVPLEQRIEITLHEYVTLAQQEYIEQATSIDEGLNQWLDYILASVNRLKKSLGGARLQEMLAMVNNAYAHQASTGSTEQHKQWIEIFLRDYYDPMYEYQMNLAKDRIVFQGNEDAVLQYMKEHI